MFPELNPGLEVADSAHRNIGDRQHLYSGEGRRDGIKKLMKLIPERQVIVTPNPEEICYS